LIIEYDEENRENTFKWIKSGITRVYKYNTDMLLTATETVKLTEMATQHIGQFNRSNLTGAFLLQNKIQL